MIEYILLAVGVFFFAMLSFYIGKTVGRLAERISWEQKLPGLRKDIAAKSRSVIGGHVSEQFAPYLSDFAYKPTEAKFLGAPIDFVVFSGLDGKHVDEIVFVEVKSGSSRLNSVQQSVRKAIEQGKVSFYEYRVD